MWNVNNSKFYAQMMDSLAAFFGLKSEDTTEAELHQKLTEAKTQTELAEKAKAEGLAAAAAELEKVKAEVVRLTSELETATTGQTTLSEQIATLNAEKTKLSSDLAAANATIAAKVAEMNTLAAEVARLTAGKKPGGSGENDDEEELGKPPVGKGVSVKTEWLEKSIFGNK